MVKVEAVMVRKMVRKNQYEDRLDHFKATIGDKVYDPVPIGFLRISELPLLQEMLEEAYSVGEKEGASNPYC